ncbi:MAG: DUF1697 domain-containing protein [Rhodobacteraceae bacterium]|nr:DUF1697 domain-containing protein [Paracoccaceae bacterium]
MMKDGTARVAVLLRGVNVGGAGTRLPMAAFRAVLEGLGCREVRTHIQSGNAVCLSAMPPAALAAAIGAAITLPGGAHPAATVLPCAALAGALAANPFPAAEAAPATLHLFFLAPEAETGGTEAAGPAGERALRRGDVLYLHTPAGFGTSPLARRLVRQLGRAATARNLATVRALATLCATPSA